MKATKKILLDSIYGEGNKKTAYNCVCIEKN